MLLVNNGNDVADVTVSLAALGVPCAAASSCRARDVWRHANLGAVHGSYTAKALTPHASALVVINASGGRV